MNSMGYKVLRFTNKEVIEDMENVITTIIYNFI